MGYDPETQTMEVEFVRGGAIWQYAGVSERTYLGLLNAPSIGRAFNEFRHGVVGARIS
jgi:hypothetical protein